MERFWRPHPDLDRAAAPALPPGGGRPLCGGRFALLAAVPPAAPGHRDVLARARALTPPRSSGGAWASVRCAGRASSAGGVVAGPGAGAAGGRSWAVSQIELHRFKQAAMPTPGNKLLACHAGFFACRTLRRISGPMAAACWGSRDRWCAWDGLDGFTGFRADDRTSRAWHAGEQGLQQQDGPLLGQRLVPGAAFGGLHT